MWPWRPGDLSLPPNERRRPPAEYPELIMFEGNTVAIPQITHADQSQLTTWYTQHAVQFIEQNKERPFFLYLAHNMPHVPLHVSDKFRGKTVRGLYGDVIEEIDWSVGQVMDALKRTGVEEQTWVIFTSDNGPWLSYGNHAGSAIAFARRQGNLLGRRHARAVHHALARQIPPARKADNAHDHRFVSDHRQTGRGRTAEAYD